MKVLVDLEQCEGNRKCMLVCPEVFRVDEASDRVELLVAEPDESLRRKVQEAVDKCPRGALSLLDQ